MSTRTISSTTLKTAALLALSALTASAAVKPALLKPQQQFQQPSVILTGSWPAGIQSADLNGDGYPDLIYTDYGAAATSSTTHILLNNGDGTFTPGQTIATAGASIAVADFDRDGHPDIEWVWSVMGEGRVYFAHGNGDGTFAPTIMLGTFAQIGTNLPQLSYVTAAPMHDTGYLDLLVEDTANSSLFELTAGPSNTLIRLFGIQLARGTGPVATADINSDGHTDLLIQSIGPTGNGEVNVFFGSSNGLLSAPTSYYGPTGIHSFLLQDMDGDGHPDLLIEGITGTLAILHGFPDGTFATTSEGGTGALNPATGAGGHLIGVTGPASSQSIYTATPAGISLLQSQSNLNITLQGLFNAGPSPATGTGSYVVADFNNDGVPDIALDSPEGIAILFGNPDGTLQTSLAFSANQPALSGTLGSFTGSGNLDALVTTSATTSATHAQLFPGHGDGTFGPPTAATPPTASAVTTLPPSLSPPTQPNLTLTSVITADLDNDGNLDIIATFDNTTVNHANPSPTTPNQIYIWYGSANGTYTTPTVITPSRNFNQVAAADMSNDGQLDLVLTDGYLVAIIRNLGNRTFGTEQHVLAGSNISSISTGDVNKDGTTDLVLSNGKLTNPDVTTGGITVLLSKLTAKAVTGSLTSSPNTTAPGQTYTITASVQPMTSGPSVTGTVAFALDGAPIGTVFVSGGIATITGPGTAPVGTHILTAQYSGDNTYAPTQLNTSHAVTGISTTIVLSITTGSQIFYGQTVDGIAQAQASDSSQLTGTITFYDGATSICSIPVTGNLSCPPSAGTGFAAGTHSLTAVYSGDTTHSSSTSNIVIVTVLPDPTTATIASSLNPAPTGQSVSLTATISGNFAVPTGPVTFLDGNTVIGTETLNSSGNATLTTSNLTAGTHPITAFYGVTQNFNAATSSTINQVVTPAGTAAATAIMISSSANPAPAGQTITLTANVVTVAQSALVPTGIVTFIDGNTVLGTATLNPSGLATFITSTLAAGTHGISASYAGNAAAAPSLSSIFLEVITPASLPTPVSFIIAAGSTSVETGGSTTIPVRVSPENGFNQSVQLTCANLPTQATCAFAANTIAAGGGTTSMKLTTLAPSPCGSTTPYGSTSSLPYTGPVLAGLLIFLLPKRRRALKTLLTLIAMAGVIAVTGCGACTDLGTRPGTYTIQITGTSMGSNQITVTQNVQITVTE